MTTEQDPVLINQQDAPHLAAVLRALIAEPVRVTAPLSSDAIFEVIDRHMPLEGSEYCFCGATWGAAHLAAALAGDREEFGVFEPAGSRGSACRSESVRLPASRPAPNPNQQVQTQEEK